MLCRCEKPSTDYYHRYGGRGIKVCPEWHKFETFLAWAFESGYDPYAPFGKCTLDRIDNDGDYCPENCRWISTQEQDLHTSRNQRLTYKGETLTLIEWSKQTGIPAMTIYKRFNLGMSADKILAPYNLQTGRPLKGAKQIVTGEHESCS